jgi:hypothetical protein
VPERTSSRESSIGTIAPRPRGFSRLHEVACPQLHSLTRWFSALER